MDLEESDLETRRRLCMKFVHALSRKYPEVAGLLLGLSEQLNNEYMANKNENWRQKTTLVNLLITASMGNYTYRHGATDL